MNAKQVREMLLDVSGRITTQRDYLCRLDSFIGDADHGVTVERGFKAVKQALESHAYSTPGEVLEAVADTLLDSMGGAIGPILGSFFGGCVKKLGDQPEMGAEEFSQMLSLGLRRIKIVGEAEEGDRTLIDALSPAVVAFAAAKDAKEPLAACMDKAALAAERGAENTKNMVAKRGRAKFIGEKSLGYVDAGSVTMSLILRYMSDFMNR